MEKLLNTISCHKCNKLFAACITPYCYQDSEWLETIRVSSLKGNKIDFTPDLNVKMDECTCDKPKDLFNQ